MRLNRTDILPLFVIIGAGVVAAGMPAALVASASHPHVSASLHSAVAPESAPEPTLVGPVWSPAGTSLMWSADGTWGELECAAGDASASRLPRSEVAPFYVTVSPDGRWLTYQNRRHEVHVRPRGNEQLCVGVDGKARIFRRVPAVTFGPTPIVILIRLKQGTQRR